MHEGAVEGVRATGGETSEFPVTRFASGSTISPYLFALIMDVFTTHIQ